jgi:hypothetical protein
MDMKEFLPPWLGWRRKTREGGTPGVSEERKERGRALGEVEGSVGPDGGAWRSFGITDSLTGRNGLCVGCRH